MGRGMYENHCTYGHADAFHRQVSHIPLLQPGLQGGAGTGRQTK